MSDNKSARLNSLDKDYNFDIYEGAVGPSVIDVSSLYAQTGQFTYDPGFTSTASCKSTITFIDGDEGTLLHRGYPIEQLADKGSFIETCYLLLNGELPSAQQLQEFETAITRHTMLHEQMNRFFHGFRRDDSDYPPYDAARANEPFLPWFPPRRASDGDYGWRCRRAVCFLS